MNDFAFFITHNCSDSKKNIYDNLKQINKLYPNNKVYIVLDISRIIFNEYDYKYNEVVFNINNMNLNLKIEFLKFNKRDRISFTYKDIIVDEFIFNIKENYILILDDDCFLLNNGLVEWSYNQLINSNIGVVCEIIRPSDINNKIINLSIPRLERFSNWFIFIDKNKLIENNIRFIPENKETLLEFYKNDFIEAKKRKMDPVRDDFGYIYIQFKKRNINVLDLRQYIYFYNKSDSYKYSKEYNELFETNGIRQFNYYYYHFSHFTKCNTNNLFNKLIELSKKIDCHDLILC